LERLPYLHAVVRESLRLYPPAYMMARANVTPVAIGEYEIPAGTTILSSQWVTHRDARYFEEPEAFRPERWLDGLEERLAGGTYYPFGDGPRRCIGQGFALLEIALAIAAIAQKFRFTLTADARIEVEPLITLRPRYGIPMRIQAR
jgi:cytochrome P450